jgi:hypothetical protein
MSVCMCTSIDECVYLNVCAVFQSQVLLKYYMELYILIFLFHSTNYPGLNSTYTKLMSTQTLRV